jgi:hypothetical protein
MPVTTIHKNRSRGTGRAGTRNLPAPPGTPEWYEQQAARWPEHATDLLAEAARLRDQQAQAA